jgi:hypothetical protein
MRVRATERVVRSTSFTPSVRLEVLQPARKRGLGDVERARGAQERAFVRDRDEGLHAEGVELHAETA